MSRAYVVKGAVIISDDGNQVKYHPHCDNCGYTMEGTTSRGSVGSGIRANLGCFTCPKCGETIWVQINRDC